MQQKQKAAEIFQKFRKQHKTGLFGKYIIISKKEYNEELMAPIMRIMAEMERQLREKQ
jgi:hypothetical protein